MQVTVKLFASLRNGRFDCTQWECPEHTTIRQVLDQFSIPVSEAAIIFRNGRHAMPEDALGDNDTVSIFPPVGGG